MLVRGDNQYNTAAEGRTILGQPMLFECMGISVLSLAHECKMRGYRAYLPIVKDTSILFQFSHNILQWTALSWNFSGIKKKQNPPSRGLSTTSVTTVLHSMNSPDDSPFSHSVLPVYIYNIYIIFPSG